MDVRTARTMRWYFTGLLVPQLMLVAPRDPETSYLVHKLEGRSSIIGLRMPRNGPPYFTGRHVRVIERWIELGASI